VSAVADQTSTAADALLGLLLPVWQIAIGLCLAAVLVIALWRLAARGPSRMATAMMVTGAAVIGLAVVGVLLEGS
jgi:hypothetical protein